jgi:hypothetical protein
MDLLMDKRNSNGTFILTGLLAGQRPKLLVREMPQEVGNEVYFSPVGLPGNKLK